MLIQAILLVCVLLTSILSGVLGMAGGMILMAILVSVVSVSAAMMVHGAVQATANGSRAWFLRSHIQWRILPTYALGAAISLGAFWSVTLVPNASVILIIVGLLPWLARLIPKLRGLDVCHPTTAFLCGTVVTSAQLFAGASGPLLDVFYLNSPLNRYQVIASKALTQTLGHLLKLIYYGLIIGVVDGIPWWFYTIAMVVAVTGTRIGTRVLERISDTRFRQISGYVILFIAAVCALKGTLELLAGGN